MSTKPLFLVYIIPVGKNCSEQYEYDFLFSETPDLVWGVDWDNPTPKYCVNTQPEPSSYHMTKRLKTIIPFGLIQDSTTFSIKMAVDGIVSLAWEDITNYEEYPEDGRIHFMYGESLSNVENKLAKRQQLFIDNEF